MPELFILCFNILLVTTTHFKPCTGLFISGIRKCKLQSCSYLTAHRCPSHQLLQSKLSKASLLGVARNIKQVILFSFVVIKRLEIWSVRETFAVSCPTLPTRTSPTVWLISSQGNNKGTQEGTSSVEEGAAERGWAGLITPAPVSQEESSWVWDQSAYRRKTL